MAIGSVTFYSSFAATILKTAWYGNEKFELNFQFSSNWYNSFNYYNYKLCETKFGERLKILDFAEWNLIKFIHSRCNPPHLKN